MHLSRPERIGCVLRRPDFLVAKGKPKAESPGPSKDRSMAWDGLSES